MTAILSFERWSKIAANLTISRGQHK